MSISSCLPFLVIAMDQHSWKIAITKAAIELNLPPRLYPAARLQGVSLAERLSGGGDLFTCGLMPAGPRDYGVRTAASPRSSTASRSGQSGCRRRCDYAEDDGRGRAAMGVDDDGHDGAHHTDDGVTELVLGSAFPGAARACLVASACASSARGR